MPTKIKVTRAEGSGFKVGISFECPANDPMITKVCEAIGLCMKAILAPEEITEFLRQLEDERAKLAKSSVANVPSDTPGVRPSKRKKSAGSDLPGGGGLDLPGGIK